MKDTFFSGEQKASEFLTRPTPPPPVVIEEPVVEIPPEIPPTIDEIPPKNKSANNDEEEIPQLSDEDLEEEAESYVMLVEMLLNLIFSVAAKYKRNSKAKEIAGESGAEKLKAIVKKLKANERAKKDSGVINIDTLTEEEKLLVELNTEVEAYLDEIDLSESEKNRLIKPLKIILKRRKKRMSPEAMLFAGFASIAVTRIAMLKFI